MKNGLLTIDKTSMKALHDIYGFDYNKPYILHEVNGAFTVKALEKIAEKYGMNGHNSVMVCVLKNEHSWRGNRLMTVKLDGRGGFDIDVKAHKNGVRHTLVDDYFRKADFNEDRKIKDVQAWLICQETWFVGKRYEWQYNKNNSSIEYDKNGCNLTQKRIDLKQKARALRAERKKAAYLETDNTLKLATLEKRLVTVKNILAARLNAASTFTELDNITTALSRWSGLTGLYKDFETLKTDDINRRFSSVESFEYLYNRIAKGLEKIQPASETETAETITATAFSDIA